ITRSGYVAAGQRACGRVVSAASARACRPARRGWTGPTRTARALEGARAARRSADLSLVGCGPLLQDRVVRGLEGRVGVEVNDGLTLDRRDLAGRAERHDLELAVVVSRGGADDGAVYDDLHRLARGEPAALGDDRVGIAGVLREDVGRDALLGDALAFRREPLERHVPELPA